MGAHSAAGHGSRRTVTATAGLAAALVTTAATGLLTGGTALATDGWDGSGGHGGSGHSHGHGHSSHTRAGAGSDGASTAGSGLGAQAWCDVMGDVDLGDDYSCASDDGSSDASADDATASTATASTTTASTTTASTAAAATPAPATPAPKPRPTSSVPDHPTIQPIVAPPSGRKVVPIAAAG
jgi:hypothetical protein